MAEGSSSGCEQHNSPDELRVLEDDEEYRSMMRRLYMLRVTQKYLKVYLASDIATPLGNDRSVTRLIMKLNNVSKFAVLLIFESTVVFWNCKNMSQ